jgi:hypothetical protein
VKIKNALIAITAISMLLPIITVSAAGPYVVKQSSTIYIVVFPEQVPGEPEVTYLEYLYVDPEEGTITAPIDIQWSKWDADAHTLTIKVDATEKPHVSNEATGSVINVEGEYEGGGDWFATGPGFGWRRGA